MIVLVLLVLLGSGANGQSALEPPNPGRAKGYCLGRENDISLKYGQSISLVEDCHQMVCYKDGTVEYNRCGTAPHPCYKPGDELKPYPDCCTRLSAPCDAKKGKKP